MNNSETSVSDVLQSTSLLGKEELSRAFLRRCVSLWVRADTRAFVSATIFSRTRADCVLSSRLVDFNRSFKRLATIAETMFLTAGVPRISLV